MGHRLRAALVSHRADRIAVHGHGHGLSQVRVLQERVVLAERDESIAKRLHGQQLKAGVVLKLILSRHGDKVGGGIDLPVLQGQDHRVLVAVDAEYDLVQQGALAVVGHGEVRILLQHTVFALYIVVHIEGPVADAAVGVVHRIGLFLKLRLGHDRNPVARAVVEVDVAGAQMVHNRVLILDLAVFHQGQEAGSVAQLVFQHVVAGEFDILAGQRGAVAPDQVIPEGDSEFRGILVVGDFLDQVVLLDSFFIDLKRERTHQAHDGISGLIVVGPDIQVYRCGRLTDAEGSSCLCLAACGAALSGCRRGLASRRCGGSSGCCCGSCAASAGAGSESQAKSHAHRCHCFQMLHFFPPKDCFYWKYQFGNFSRNFQF